MHREGTETLIIIIIIIIIIKDSTKSFGFFFRIFNIE